MKYAKIVPIILQNDIILKEKHKFVLQIDN